MGAPFPPEVPTWAFSLESEQALLGALLLDGQAFDRIADLITESDFYTGAHRMIFRHVSRLVEAARVVDMVTVGERCQAEDAQRFQEFGFGYLAQLAQNTPSAINVRRYAEVVRERSLMRQLHSTAMAVVEATMHSGGREISQLLDEAQTKIMAVGEGRQSEAFLPLKKGLAQAFEFIDHQHNRDDPNAPTGTPYGFIDLDQMTSGMHPGQLIVLAARPAMGKSAFALNVCENVARFTKRWALFFTIEMGLREQSLRMLAASSKVNVQRLAAGRVYDKEWPRITQAMEKLIDLPIAFNEQAALTINDLRAQSRRASRELGHPSVIVVDYLQLMLAGDTEQNRATQLAEVTRGLKLLAKELEVPVIALSQLNRDLEKRVNKRPVMSDLRDSGAIEQDADVVLAIYRDEVYHPNSAEKGVAEIIINKQRNGPVGDVKLTFLADYTRFVNYARPDTSE
jgi:replicative DNA helicase